MNAKGLDFYDRLVDGLLAAKVRPFCTLFHWDYPTALYDRSGWLHQDSPQWFADYTSVVARRLGDRIGDWMTFNEPQCFIGLGHGTGGHAPGLKLPADRLRQICFFLPRARLHQQPGFLAQQLQKLISAELLLLRGPQRGQGQTQIVQLGIQLLSAVVALTGHHLSKTLTPLPLLHRVGRQHRLTAEPPGPPRREQLRQSCAQPRRFRRLDPQIESGR